MCFLYFKIHSTLYQSL